MGILQIRLLGHLEISQADSTPQLRLSAACQKLLAYLLLNTGKMCRREVVMEVFWQDHNLERARSCLNSAIWRLRRELEKSGSEDASYLLTSDSLEIGFNWECDYWLDTQTFEQTLFPILHKSRIDIEAEEMSRIEGVLALYRGELLEGIYDEWTLLERERLRTLYLNSLMHLMNYHAQCNAFDKSLRFAKAILADDPLREDIHRHIMRLYGAIGQRALAVQQYRICSAVLKRELDIVPMEETQQLHQQILGSSTLAQPLPLDMSLAPLRNPLREPLPAHSNTEKHLQMIVRNLEQAHTHLNQAAQLLARLAPPDKQYSE